MENVTPPVAAVVIAVFVIVCLAFLTHYASHNNRTW